MNFGRGAATTRLLWIVIFTLTLLAIAAVPLFVKSPSSLARPTAQRLTMGSAEGPNPGGLALPTGDDVARGMARIEHEEAELAEWLATPAAAKERMASLGAYGDLSSVEAADLLSSQFGEQLEALDLDPARFLSDARLTEVLGETAATVVSDGNSQLLDAGIPVREENQQGQLEKVDLSLVSAPAGFETSNALIDLRVPNSPDDAVELGGGEFQIAQAGASAGSTAQRLGNTNVFFPEVDTDTDLLVSPTSTGVELFDQLRSPDSPGTLKFELMIPQGAHLRQDGAGGAEVVNAGDVLMQIPAPTAVDAQGASVPVDISVEDTSIVLHVNPVEVEVAYPVLVDPIVEDWANASWYNGANLESLTNGAWQWFTNNSHILGSTFCIFSCWNSGRGLYISADGAALGAEQFGRWSYSTPNAQSFISQAWITAFLRNDYACTSSGQPHDYDGFWTAAGAWNGLHTEDALSGQSSISGEGQTFMIGLGSGNGAKKSNCVRDIVAGGVALWLDDYQQPSLETTSTGQWMDNVPVRLNVSASDPGLGVKSIVASATSASGTARIWSTTNPCTGLYGSRCPGTWNLHDPNQPDLSYDPSVLPEGVDSLSVTAVDVTGKQSSTHGMTVRVDHAPPTLAFSGSLTEQSTIGTSNPTYKLHVVATDGDSTSPRSGATGFVVKIDGKQVDSFQPGCSTQSCSAFADYTLTAAGFSLGHHVLVVEAKDALNHVATKELGFDFGKDTSAPTLTVTGGLVSGSIAGPHDGAQATATDSGSGVKALKFKIDGELIEEATQECAGGACSFSQAFAKHLSRIPSGSHAAEFIAVDVAGNQKAISVPIVLDSTPPTISLSGPLADEEGAVAERFRELTTTVEDAGIVTSGVIGISVSVDGEVVQEWNTCQPGCPGKAARSYTYDREAWPGGKHDVTVLAEDSRGNLSAASVDVGSQALSMPEPECPTVEQGGRESGRISPEQALATLQELNPPAVAESQPSVDVETQVEVDPALVPSNEDLAIDGTLPGGELTSRDPSTLIGAAVCIAPAEVSSGVYEVLRGDGDVAVYADTQEDVDTAIRPTAMGAVLMTQLRSESAPPGIQWAVGLEDEQHLDVLPSGAVAIVEPAAPAEDDPGAEFGEDDPPPTEEAPAQPPVTEVDRLVDAEAQLEMGRWLLESSEVEASQEEEVVAVVAAPWVRDAAGQSVPAYLTVAEDTITINVQVEEAEDDGELEYPLFVGDEVATSSSSSSASPTEPPTCAVKAHQPYLKKARRLFEPPEGPLYWYLRFGGSLSCQNVGFGRLGVHAQRRRVAVLFVHWDSVGGSTHEEKFPNGLVRMRTQEGAECDGNDVAHDFRTQVDGTGLSSAIVCAREQGGVCHFTLQHHSATSRRRCGLG